MRPRRECRDCDRAASAGVWPDDRDAIFTLFFTTKEHGTGLGLAIAREFAEAHGGQLYIADDGVPGATFVPRLPVAPRDA